MADYLRDVKKKLGEHGFYLKRRGHGDHDVWENPEKHKTVVVPYNLRKRHTANGIMKQAEINHKF